MSVSDGEKVNAAISNAAWMSRDTDTNTTGKVDLENIDAVSGSSVLNAQKSLNGQASFSGADPNGLKDQLPAFTSNAIGTASDSLKVRQDAVQAQTETNTADIALNTSDIADVRTTTGTADGDVDMGSYVAGANGFNLTASESTKQNLQGAIDGIDARILLTEKAAANGVATLDGTGRMPAGQLPTSATEYKGAWDVATNTPTLIDGTGTNGDLYRISVAGTRDLGSGSETYALGDVVIYNGTIWQRIPADNVITSVNGQIGVVVLDTDDVAEGVTSLYYTEPRVTANAAVALNTAKVSADGSIDTHSDVDTTTTPPALSEVLTWDGANWVPGVGGGGSGQGGINYIKNADFETDDADVVVTANITKSLETVDPIRGAQSLKLTIDTLATVADSADIEMNDVDPIDVEGSKVLPISFEYYTDANFTTDDVQFVLRRIDATAADIILEDELEGKVLSSTSKIRFTSRAQIDSDANTYALRMKVLVAPSSASAIFIDNVKIGPDNTVPGFIGTEWQEYTPTFTTSGGGNITLNATSAQQPWAFFRRIGDQIEINYGFRNGTGGGAAGAAGIMRMGFPPNITRQADGSSKSDFTVGNFMGPANTSTGTAALGSYDVFGNLISVSDGGSGTITVSDITAGFALAGHARFKAAGLSATAALSTSEATVTTVTVAGAGNASTVLTADVTPIDFIETDDNHNLWDGTSFTAPRTGYYDINGSVIVTVAGATQITLHVDSVNTQQVGSVVNDSVIPFSGAIRLVKGEVLTVIARTGRVLSNNSAYHWINITSRPDFSVFSVYGETALIESSSAIISYPITVGQYGDLTSIDLPSGEWDIHVQVSLDSSAATTTGNVIVGVSTTPGNSAAGLVSGDTQTYVKKSTGGGEGQMLSVSKRGITTTSETTYYLKALAVGSITNLNIAYKISARKIK